MELLRTAGRPPFTSAHRGHSTGAPENTLAALDAAWRAGATVAEIDVRMTRDGELVLLHDRTLDRTTTGHGPASACTLAELAELDAGSWFGLAFAGEPIPNDKKHLHFGAGQTEARIELPPGRHTIQLVLGDADHVPQNPPIISKRITVIVPQ